MDWQPIIDQIVAALVPIVVAGLSTLIALGLKQLNAWVAAKTKNEEMKIAMQQLQEAVNSTVHDLEASVRRYMSDGKLTDEEITSLRDQALSRVKAQAPEALRALTKAGLSEVNTFILGKIEQANAQITSG